VFVKCHGGLPEESTKNTVVILFLGLLYVNFQIAWVVFFTFLIMGTVINRLLSDRARKFGAYDSNLSIESSEKLIEALSSYREIIVRGRRDFYALKIGLIRTKLSKNLAETAFLPILIRYIIEGTIVIGSLVLSAYQFLTLDAERAISTLAVFLAAGTRIAPAILRIQQGVIQIRGGLGSAAPTLHIIDEIGLKPVLNIDQDYVNFDHASFVNTVEIKNLHFNYPGKEKPAIDNITMTIPSGKIVSIVGRSGAGKTTLVDCILGLLPKTSGEIYISNTTPEVAINKWPGAIGYVPQNITIANCSIEENIRLGFDNLSEANQYIYDALEIVGLTEFVNNLTEGLKTQVGERGVKLSGGQRQRLGIARALFTKPKLLILDEATSSLDAESESAISSAIRKISKETTTIIIAHRLNTIRDSDQVVYLDQGKVIYSGTFNEVRKNVLEFDNQAKLMGL
jgi:ABC-type multidrug transport system fused ATPase/permease subunit